MLLMYCFRTQPVCASQVHKIAFTKYPQEKSNWCWLASAECSGKHLLSSSKTQLGAILTVKGTSANVGGSIQ